MLFKSESIWFLFFTQMQWVVGEPWRKRQWRGRKDWRESFCNCSQCLTFIMKLFGARGHCDFPFPWIAGLFFLLQRTHTYHQDSRPCQFISTCVQHNSYYTCNKWFFREIMHCFELPTFCWKTIGQDDQLKFVGLSTN